MKFCSPAPNSLARLAVISLLGLVLGATTVAHAEKVYDSNFSGADQVSDAWSVQKIGATPNGKRKCLGPFENSDKAELKLKSLPRHDLISLEVELFVIGPWTGDDAQVDAMQEFQLPSIWSLRVDSGPVLFDAALDNRMLLPSPLTDDVLASHLQGYPCLLTGERLPGQCGSVERGSLGATFGGDSVYRLKFVFPHQSEALGLEFAGENLFEIMALDKSLPRTWALGAVKVETLRAADLPPLANEEFERIWKDLAARDPETGYKAGWKLVAQGDRAVEMLSKKALPQKAGDRHATEQRLKKLLVDLNSDRYSLRQQASKQLSEMAHDSGLELRRALATARTAEVRNRLRQIVEQAELLDPSRLNEQSRRQLRVERVLEIIHTPAATELLKQFGQ